MILEKSEKMKNFFHGIRNILDTLSTSRYPEYDEYRDIDTDRLAQEQNAHLNESAGDIESSKLFKLKFVAVLTIIICTALVIYFHFESISKQPVGIESLRGRVSEEMLSSPELGNELPGAKKKESLEDIQRWAADMDAQIQKEINNKIDLPNDGVNQNLPKPNTMPRYYGEGRIHNDTISAREIEMLMPLDTALYEKHEESISEGVGDNIQNENVSSNRNSSLNAEEPPAQRSNYPQTYSDTPSNPYARRELSPVNLQPINHEPY